VKAMATYVSLYNFTDQGIRTIKEPYRMSPPVSESITIG
jgi:uncharacterized protein with GYD domain